MNLQELYQSIQKYQPNICQISVLQGGNKIYEQFEATFPKKKKLKLPGQLF